MFTYFKEILSALQNIANELDTFNVNYYCVNSKKINESKIKFSKITLENDDCLLNKHISIHEKETTKKGIYLDNQKRMAK